MFFVKYRSFHLATFLLSLEVGLALFEERLYALEIVVTTDQ